MFRTRKYWFGLICLLVASPTEAGLHITGNERCIEKVTFPAGQTVIYEVSGGKVAEKTVSGFKHTKVKGTLKSSDKQFGEAVLHEFIAPILKLKSFRQIFDEFCADDPNGAKCYAVAARIFQMAAWLNVPGREQADFMTVQKKFEEITGGLRSGARQQVIKIANALYAAAVKERRRYSRVKETNRLKRYEPAKLTTDGKLFELLALLKEQNAVQAAQIGQAEFWIDRVLARRAAKSGGQSRSFQFSLEPGHVQMAAVGALVGKVIVQDSMMILSDEQWEGIYENHLATSLETRLHYFGDKSFDPEDTSKPNLFYSKPFWLAHEIGHLLTTLAVLPGSGKPIRLFLDETLHFTLAFSAAEITRQDTNDYRDFIAKVERELIQPMTTITEQAATYYAIDLTPCL